MIQIDMLMPEKCSDCIFCDDNCSCVASEYDGLGINVGCAYRTDRRDIRCPLKDEHDMPCFNCPMQPIRPTYHDNKVYCGQCGKRIPLKIKANYCHKCGREINWLP